MKTYHFPSPFAFVSALAMLAGCFAWLAHAQTQKPSACCSITGIDVGTQVVNAKVNATSQTFQFMLTNRELTRQLRVGESVYANFGTKQVSLDGRTIVGVITAIATAPPTSGPAPIPNPASSNSPAPTGSGTGGSTGTNTTGQKPSGSNGGKGIASQYVQGGRPTLQTNVCRDASGNGINSPGIDLLPAEIGAIVVAGTTTIARTTAPRSVGDAQGSTQVPGPHVRFTLENCGDTASQTPFVTDIYINGTRADTIEIPNAIQPHSAMGIVSSLANLASTGSCNSASVRVVVDSQNKVQDSNPANNDQTAQITPPCPDLAVTSIWRHWLDDLHTQFEIRYTVANLGNAPIPHPVRIHGWGVPSPGIPPDLPVNYEEMLNSLSPGESRDFQIHQAFWKGDSVELKIAVDADDTIAEPNKTNNLMSGTY